MNLFELTKRLFALLALPLILCGCSGPPAGAEFLKREVVVDSSAYGYRVFVPKDHKTGQKLPVMLYLHGAGSRGDDNESPVRNFSESIGENPEKFPFLIVVPQCREDTFWGARDMAAQAMAALGAAVKEFNGDEERVYLAGFSMGGYGVWQLAVGYPDKFAALVPIAGAVTVTRDLTPQERATILPDVLKLMDTPDPHAAFAEKLAGKPVWLFHGSADEAVGVDGSRKMAEALQKAGNTNVKYTEFENAKHLVAGKALNQPGLVEWLMEQRIQKLNEPL